MKMLHVLLILLGLFGSGSIGGCGGGSGSSGFDLRAREEQAIAAALQERRCVVLAATGQQVCPLENETPANATSGDDVLFTPAGVALRCALTRERCVLQFVLQVGALRGEEAFISMVAVRAAQEGAPWHLLDPGRALAEGQLVDYALDVPKQDLGLSAGVETVQLAVLLFSERPSSLPEVVATLSDTGAHSFFVTGALPVATAGPSLL
ncbi:MAG: hypothetical protein N3C12_14130 [Candidatus Binatia bacterium]|nr:hypothetical protein [Candidatus Binatia bacterium]